MSHSPKVQECPRCGSMVEGGWRRCRECGADVEREALVRRLAALGGVAVGALIGALVGLALGEYLAPQGPAWGGLVSVAIQLLLTAAAGVGGFYVALRLHRRKRPRLY